MPGLDSAADPVESAARMNSGPNDSASARSASRLAIAGWVMFDWACQPFFTLIITFVYAPYFASAVVGDAVHGQALWGFATGAAGIFIALFSPVLGAIADATGRRKPWIAAFGILLVVGSTLLWFGKSGDASTIPIVLMAFVIGAIGVEFATVFNNSMMPSLVPKERLGRLSGLGWGMGYVGGLVSLVVALGFLAANPVTGKTLFGLTPLFGLDPVLREGDRVTGPLTALWFIVFVLPLFLFTPDGARGLPLARAIGSGWAAIRETFREARRHRNLGLFLLANMIYADGLVALFAFGGIYAVGTFGWHTIELGIFGILLTITGTIGAISGGWLDDRFGPKRVILGALVLLLLATATILSVERDKILFVIAVDAAGDRRRSVRERGGEALSRARAVDRVGGGPAAGGFAHAAGAAGAARKTGRVFRPVRAVGKDHVVRGSDTGRDGDGADREPESGCLGSARILHRRRAAARARADQWRKCRDAGEHHGDAGLVGGGDHFLVAD